MRSKLAGVLLGYVIGIAIVLPMGYLFGGLILRTERDARAAQSITVDLPSGDCVVLSGEGRFEALDYFGEKVGHAD